MHTGRCSLINWFYIHIIMYIKLPTYYISYFIHIGCVIDQNINCQLHTSEGMYMLICYMMSNAVYNVLLCNLCDDLIGILSLF